MEKIHKFLEFIKPYQGIIYFVVLLLGTHLLWKLVVTGNMSGHEIAIFGVDMTAQFTILSYWTTRICYSIIKLFPDTGTFISEGTIMYFTDTKFPISIIWGCTGVKQLYCFATIILLYTGPLKDKLWYIPLGCLILWAYNIIRIVSICFLTRNHPEWFDALHEGWFRYIYYGIIFLLWVIWEEKIARKNIQTVSQQYSYANT